MYGRAHWQENVPICQQESESRSLVQKGAGQKFLVIICLLYLKQYQRVRLCHGSTIQLRSFKWESGLFSLQMGCWGTISGENILQLQGDFSSAWLWSHSLNPYSAIGKEDDKLNIDTHILPFAADTVWLVVPPSCCYGFMSSTDCIPSNSEPRETLPFLSFSG